MLLILQKNINIFLIIHNKEIYNIIIKIKKHFIAIVLTYCT